MYTKRAEDAREEARKPNAANKKEKEGDRQRRKQMYKRREIANLCAKSEANLSKGSERKEKRSKS
jgi:hypothetical protein